MSKALPQTCKVKLTGTAPYLMHNVRLANPLDIYTKELKRLTGKRNKTDEDHEEVMKAEYFGGLYWSEVNCLYIPGRQIDAAMLVAAKTKKLGKQLARGVWVLNDELPLAYSGPINPEDLYADPSFVDIRPVTIGGRKVMRCRPIFREWSLTVELLVDENVMNQRDVEDIMKIAGQLIGIGELRPRYGRFDVQVLR